MLLRIQYRMATRKRIDIDVLEKMWGDWKIQTLLVGDSYFTGGVVKWYNHLGKQSGVFFKILNVRVIMRHRTSAFGTCPREIKRYIHTETCILMFIAG